MLDTVLVLEEIGKTDYVTAMAVLGEVETQTRIIAIHAPESIKSAYCRASRAVSIDRRRVSRPVSV